MVVVAPTIFATSHTHNSSSKERAYAILILVSSDNATNSGAYTGLTEKKANEQGYETVTI